MTSSDAIDYNKWSYLWLQNIQIIVNQSEIGHSLFLLMTKTFLKGYDSTSFHVE